MMLRAAMRRATIGLAFAVAVALGSAVSPAVASNGDTDDGAITWMVRPSDGVGEDGRSWVELTLEPGEAVQEYLLVRNLSPEAVTFTLSAADGYFTDTGRFTMLTSNEPSTDAGTWITIQDSVEVLGGDEVIVPFTVSVPQNATPGDHAAGVAASIRSGGDDTVGVESRIGFRVMTRVTGELTPSASAAITGTYSGAWNPMDPGRLDLDYTLTNTGNTRLSVRSQITAAALFGLVTFTVAGEEVVEFAPGETREGRVTLPAVWPLFVYTTDLVATSTPVSDAPSPADGTTASAASSVAAVPWSQAVVIAVGAALLRWLWVDRRRRSAALR